MEVPQRDVRGEPPRVGVFVCSCGINIAGVVDVKAVMDYAATLPNVVYVENNLFTCSQDTQDKMTEVIKEQGLNRMVVAACSPRTHEPLFQETLQAAGINKYLFDLANIRNQDSWVHAERSGGGHREGQGPGAHGRGQGFPAGASDRGQALHPAQGHGHRRRVCRA